MRRSPKIAAMHIACICELTKTTSRQSKRDYSDETSIVTVRESFDISGTATNPFHTLKTVNNTDYDTDIFNDE
jgi:hypothetical protein